MGDIVIKIIIAIVLVIIVCAIMYFFILSNRLDNDNDTTNKNENENIENIPQNENNLYENYDSILNENNFFNDNSHEEQYNDDFNYNNSFKENNKDFDNIEDDFANEVLSNQMIHNKQVPQKQINNAPIDIFAEEDIKNNKPEENDDYYNISSNIKIPPNIQFSEDKPINILEEMTSMENNIKETPKIKKNTTPVNNKSNIKELPIAEDIHEYFVNQWSIYTGEIPGGNLFFDKQATNGNYNKNDFVRLFGYDEPSGTSSNYIKVIKHHDYCYTPTITGLVKVNDPRKYKKIVFCNRDGIFSYVYENKLYSIKITYKGNSLPPLVNLNIPIAYNK